jgi:uncharacterized protein (TIGR02588 family)
MPQKNTVEWIVFAVSLGLVLAVAGFLAYDALAGGSSSPQIVVTPGEPRTEDEVLTVPITVENRGDQAAEDVRVVVTVRQEGGAEATTELTFDLLARGASEEGEVVVSLTGAVQVIEAHAASYRLP